MRVESIWVPGLAVRGPMIESGLCGDTANVLELDLISCLPGRHTGKTQFLQGKIWPSGIWPQSADYEALVVAMFGTVSDTDEGFNTKIEAPVLSLFHRTLNQNLLATLLPVPFIAGESHSRGYH